MNLRGGAGDTKEVLGKRMWNKMLMFANTLAKEIVRDTVIIRKREERVQFRRGREGGMREERERPVQVTTNLDISTRSHSLTHWATGAPMQRNRITQELVTVLTGGNHGKLLVIPTWKEQSCLVCTGSEIRAG